MIECMTLEQMISFVSLLGEIVTVIGDYEVVRIDADAETIWWYLAPEPTDANAAPRPPMLCRGPGPVPG